MPEATDYRLKEQCVDVCEEHLQCFEADADGFLGKVITGDKTCIHYHQLENNQNEPQHLTKKSCKQPSAGKVMLSFGINEG